MMSSAKPRGETSNSDPHSNSHSTGHSTSDGFRRFALAASNRLGTPGAFIAACALVVAWAAAGPFFDFDERWQLFINSGTTIITFLMVFIIQATQNRDARAVHLKLDELIRCTNARNVFADLEDASDEELETFQQEFAKLHQEGASAPNAALEARRRTTRKHRRKHKGKS